MRTYELTVLLHPDLELDLNSALARVETFIKDSKGKILHRDNWGKRHLAYPIRKQEFAIYVFYKLELPAEKVLSLEKRLKLSDEIIRHLVVLFEEAALPASQESETEKPESEPSETATASKPTKPAVVKKTSKEKAIIGAKKKGK